MIFPANLLQLSSGSSIINDEKWMQYALNMAEEALKFAEVPVGAVIVLNQKVIGKAHNKVRINNNPCAHAEILALEEACQTINNERLIKATVYVTLEPCLMCMGALLNARIARLVFGARDFIRGAAGSKWNFATGDKVYGKIQVDEGVLEDKCAHLLTDFFQNVRSK